MIKKERGKFRIIFCQMTYNLKKEKEKGYTQAPLLQDV